MDSSSASTELYLRLRDFDEDLTELSPSYQIHVLEQQLQHFQEVIRRQDRHLALQYQKLRAGQVSVMGTSFLLIWPLVVFLFYCDF